MASAVTVSAKTGVRSAGIFLMVSARPNERTRLTVRSLPGGAVALSVAGSRIKNAAEPGLCSVHGEHSMICAPPSRSLYDGSNMLEVQAGNRGDIIDASGFEGASAALSGGAGSDRIYCPRNTACLLRGGGGKNLLVGSPKATVTFGALESANPEGIMVPAVPGLVTVDLKRGYALAPGERDRLVDIPAAEGGAGTNRLLGLNAGGELVGGSGHNLLVARGSKTLLSLPNPHLRSTLVCAGETVVAVSDGQGVDPRDELLGPCRIGAIQIRPSLASLDSPILEVFPPSIPQQQTVRRVTVRAVPSGRVVALAPLARRQLAPARVALSAGGQRSLTRSGSLRVLIEVVAENSDGTTYPPPSPETFTTVLRRRR
jgi:Ca2+-binding RTX toxin-like protein